jgi:hypothetical protein
VPEYDEYPAVTFPGYAEQPLDKQLEPIAVVGMGKKHHAIVLSIHNLCY